jgi:hypothetical protein
MVLMSLLMALGVVATVWGDSGWELDFGQTGRVGKETWDTLWLVAGLLVDILMLDMVWVVVALAVEVNAEIRMLKSMSVSQMAASSRDELWNLWVVYGG